MATTTKPRREEIPVVVGVAKAADILQMARPNVAKFLERHGYEPYARREDGQFWLREDVIRARQEYESDEFKVAADARRRKSAHHDSDSKAAVLGPTQHKTLLLLKDGPTTLPSGDHSLRLAASRLVARGLVTQHNGGTVIDGVARARYGLTPEGKKVLRLLER